MIDWKEIEKKLKTFRHSMEHDLYVDPKELKIIQERNTQAIDNFKIVEKTSPFNFKKVSFE